MAAGGNPGARYNFLQALEHLLMRRNEFDYALSALVFPAFCFVSTSAEFDESWGLDGADPSPSFDGDATADVASKDSGPISVSGSMGAMPSSAPSAARASCSNSLRLGSSSRSERPKRMRNSFDVL